MSETDRNLFAIWVALMFFVFFVGCPIDTKLGKIEQHLEKIAEAQK